MLKRKKIFLVVGAFVLTFSVLSPSVFAQGKEGLAHIVQEHTQKIEQLEEAIKNLSGSNSNESLPSEVKQALLKEASIEIKSYNAMTEPYGRGVNVIDYQIEEIKDEVILKVYTEGSNDWTINEEREAEEGEGTEAEAGEGAGRNFARALIFNFDEIAKIYGVNLKYEFYENGERITIFTDID